MHFLFWSAVDIVAMIKKYLNTVRYVVVIFVIMVIIVIDNQNKDKARFIYVALLTLRSKSVWFKNKSSSTLKHDSLCLRDQMAYLNLKQTTACVALGE